MKYTRIDQILKCIVEYFIQNAEPVGSNTLLDSYALPYSSATIRNDMLELERLGLIEKTHSSSGRVPSSEGYRYYVDNLQSKTLVGDDFKNQFALILNEKTRSMDDVIDKSCEILSSMTNLVTVILGPKSSQEKLISIQTIPISASAATAVFITDQGYVENKTFVISEGIDISHLEKCVKMLSDRLAGTPIGLLNEKLVNLRPILEDYVGKQNDIIYEAFAEAFIKFAKERMSTYGKGKLLEIPEYEKDAKKLKKVMELLESPGDLKNFVNYEEEETVRFGTDAVSEGAFNDLAIVSHKIRLGEDQFGKIALVGSKRMDYQQILATLEYVAHELSKFYSSKGDKK